MKAKKILYSMLALAMAAFTVTGCEDVPEPYEIPGAGSGNGSVVAEPAGDGQSAETAFNVAGVINYIANTEDLTQKVYIKGIVSQVDPKGDFNPSFGNLTFYISDDGSKNNEFYVYRCKNLNNTTFASTDDLKVGDRVVIYGNVTIYNGTYETSANAAYVYSINDEGGNGGSDITGENLLTNGDFETWTNGAPAEWNGPAAAADLTQSTDAHAGTYAVSVGFNAAQNKRISYKALTLKAGTYKFSFYAKSTTADKSQCRPGYAIVTSGTVSGGDAYKYGEYAALNNSSWALVENTFTLEAETTVSLIVMNPKSSDYATAQNILIDDAALVTEDGGIIDGGSDNPGGDTGNATGDGTEANPYNSVKAKEVASALADGDKTDWVYIKGKVASITDNYGNNTFGNATFTISDDGKSAGAFLIYRAMYLNNEKYTTGDVLAVGDDVVVYAQLINYKGNSPQANPAYLFSLKGNGGGNPGGDNPGGGEVTDGSITVASADLGIVDKEAATSVTLSDGTTLTFDGGGNSNVPKYYATGKTIRMYPQNSMTITSSKKIASVIFTCDVFNGTTYNASGDVAANPGTSKTEDATITISGINANSTVITNTSATTGAASQFRFTTMTINYAK